MRLYTNDHILKAGIIYWSRQDADLQTFPIGLVKTESDFIIRSFETKLERWMLMIVVIIVDAYLFLSFSYLTCHLENTGIGAFWLHCAVW